ncbi:Uncharacterized protein dnl_41130 [Desulfonema limicola]|uniref:Uncharacterized protein n=1 Tax=Desulfonema limicola TaxID=45656 RepID=A0A975GHV7_9BACT|nr:hypothetical protein [Desulfonema limicola]QTA81764.1 Uncharacterized protein dnl_41130 [Desulfonema limicola]
MKYILTAIACLSAVFIFNYHIIRIDQGFDIIAKDSINLREVYVDARNFDTGLLINCSPRLRNYLIYQVYGPSLYSNIKEKTDLSAESIKEKLKEFELNAHKWLSEKLK